MSAPTPQIREGRQRLRTFLASMSSLVGGPERDEQVVVERATQALKDLVTYDDWLDEEYATPNPDRYCQYLLYCDPLDRFSVVAFVWGPGQRTPVHNHTTWGVIGMLRGAEISQSFDLKDGVLTPTHEERLVPGDIAVVSPAVGDIHCVRNAFEDRVSISVHVYGGDIGKIQRHVYGADGAVKPFVSGYSNRTLPNVWGQP